MSKLKTKSSVKKRFRLTATGLVKFGRVGKRHGMSKRPKRMIRSTRRMAVMTKGDARHIKQCMPYGGGI